MPTEAKQLPQRVAIPFARYANGKTWKWTQGADFKCDPGSHRRYAHQWAKRHGYRCEARVRGGLVFIRFTQAVDNG